MNKNKTYIFCLMLTACAVCQAQKLDIKPYILYHQPVSSQEAPIFYTTFASIAIPQTVPASSISKNFTLARGMEYGLAVDYTLRNQLGFELGLGYFSGCIPFINKEKYEIYSSTSDWNYHSIAVRPLISYGVTNRKSTFIGKIGPTVHYASASTNLFYKDEKVSGCTFANRLNLGYSIVFEYDCQLSGRLSLAMELGLEQYKYTPQKATVEYYNDLSNQNIEIRYVNKIVGERIPLSSPYNPYIPYDESLQNKRLKQSILFNNIYLGIGIKYNLWKK